VYNDQCRYLFDKFRAPRRALAVSSHRATSWRAFSQLVEGKKEENCSLPLMTPSNNISEVRRGPYLPLPRRPTWKGRLNSGMSSARCGLRLRNLYSLAARAACVHTRRRWRPVWSTARVLLRRESLYSVPSTFLVSLSLSFPFPSSRPPTRITRRTDSADSKGRPRRMPSLDQCAHPNWMSIRWDLISTKYIKYRARSVATFLQTSRRDRN